MDVVRATAAFRPALQAVTEPRKLVRRMRGVFDKLGTFLQSARL